MDNCIFCKILKGEIPSSKVYEDDNVLAFRDIAPQAPVHILFIPKTHIESALSLNSDNDKCLGEIFSAIRKVAKDMDITTENGMRIINNCGANAGQTVKHLHFHMLAGIAMGDKII